MDSDHRSPSTGINPLSGQSTNPYAPTSHVLQAEPERSDVEAYRTYYLRHEASVKSIGTLYYFGAFLTGMGGFSVLVASLTRYLSGDIRLEQQMFVVIGIVYTSLAVAQGFAAYGLRRLRSWARNIAVALLVIGLLGFPFITLISAYFLYVLVGKKGRIVFSDEYQRVVEQTPHIVYRSSLGVWSVALLVIVLIATAMLGAMVG